MLRIFEWLDIPAHDGHPQELKKDLLDKWIGQPGWTTHVSTGPYVEYFGAPLLAVNNNQKGAYCYFGWFKHKK